MTIDESSRASLQPLHTQRLEALFRGLPTLRGVAQISAQAYLDRHFAERRLAARLISIRTPDEASRQHLADWLLKRLTTAAPVQLVDGYHSAAQWAREVYLPVALSLAELEALINQCGARLLKDFAEHLQAYWREVGVDNVSRWGHVSRELRALLPADQPSQWLAAPVPGDPFDALSASFLADQLRAIAEIDCRVPRTASDYQAMLDYILDPRRWFSSPLSPVQATLQAELPVWLAHAGVEDSLAYARLLQALARQATNTGHFLDGIGSIREFAEARLTACLKDYPFKPSEVQLHFERVIAAAVPVPGGFIAGQVEPITVNLIDLALENLSGLPFEPKAILVNGQLAPAGVTYAQLKTCVTNADVGQAYPALLKSKLLDDPAEAARRGRLFSEQLRIQLPMLALEMKIKGLNGLTEVGVQRVQAMTLWPLAFQAAPAAKADTVAAMFVLGPVDSDAGPHLLYRPLFSPTLQEFPSLDALFDAIKTPGELHDRCSPGSRRHARRSMPMAASRARTSGVFCRVMSSPAMKRRRRRGSASSSRPSRRNIRCSSLPPTR
ncbi:dermonecrotic toxin domain-containing protein [Pseudomonas sp. SDO524_S393]